MDGKAKQGKARKGRAGQVKGPGGPGRTDEGTQSRTRAGPGPRQGRARWGRAGPGPEARQGKSGQGLTGPVVPIWSSSFSGLTNSTSCFTTRAVTCLVSGGWMGPQATQAVASACRHQKTQAFHALCGRDTLSECKWHSFINSCRQ